MDSNVLSIILSVIANGLTSLTVYSGHKAGDLLVGKEFMEKWELEKTSIEPILNRAIVNVAENVEWKGRPAREEVVCLFLLSPEVEEIIRQIYSLRLEKLEDEGRQLTSIREIFLKLFTQFVTSYIIESTLKEEQLSDSADFLIEVLIKSCNLYLESAINRGILAAHEAQSAFRHNILESEIRAIQRKLDFLVAPQQLDIQAIFEFEKQYRQQIGDRHGYIIPPNFDSARRLPIDDLYVCSDFVVVSPTDIDKNEKEVINFNLFFSRIYRAVLLGNPGGGKSTLTHKLCHDLITKSSQQLLLGRKELTPIPVVLREYGVEKKEHRCSIREYIETEAKATYQLPTPSVGTIEYLLLNGRALVIFDGLDELLDTSYRQEIRDDVESFCKLYPALPILVTSREVGYENAPLDEHMFEVFRLESFNNDQVKEYVEKWFTLEDMEELPKIRQQKSNKFLEESESASDLRSNPLMLGLMCNIYRGENYIPRNRPDVYEKCATMLFDRWDRSRNIHVSLPFEAHVRPTMMFLANWIYSNEVLQAGVTERKLIMKAAVYLHQKRFEDSDEAEKAAQEFINFCQGRAWVFTDMGTEKGGEKLYQFTHRTFLEYFTAAYIVRTHTTPEELITVLLPKVVKREWDMVCQLAFQIQNKNSEDAGDKLLLALKDYSFQIEGEEWVNVMSFTLQCLSFIIPSPRVLKDLISVYIMQLIQWGIKVMEGTPPKELPGFKSLYRTVIILHEAAVENVVPIANLSEKLILESVNGNKSQDCVTLETIEMLNAYARNRPETATLWDDIYNRTLDSCSDRLQMLCLESLNIFYLAVREQRVDIGNTAEKFVKKNGLKTLFEGGMNIFECIGGWSLDFYTLFSLLTEPTNQQWGVDSILVKEFGRIILSDRSLQVQGILSSHYQVTEYLEELMLLTSKRRKKSLKLERDLFFGILVIYSAFLELILPKDEKKVLQKIETNKHPFFKLVRHILIARFKPIEQEKVQDEMDKLSFTPEQQDFIWNWVHGEINLVQEYKS